MPPSARDRARFAAGLVSLVAASALLWMALWAAAAPPLFGWSPVAVMSGSMAPSIDTGDVVVVIPHDGGEIDLGTVIVFDDPATDGRITHRVVDVTPSGEYVTRGDANGRLDSTTIRSEDIIGTGHLLVPVVATPLVWVDRGQWLLLLLGFLAIAAMLWTSRWALLDRYDPWGAQPDISPMTLRPHDSPRELTPYVVVILLSLVAVGVSTTRSRSVFAGLTDNSGNSVQAGAVAPPTALGASVGGPTSIDLTWTPSATAWADGYELYRSLASDSGYASIAVVPGQASSSHADNFSPQPGTSYYYAAETTAGPWTSVASNVASATTSGLSDVQLVGSWGTGLSHAVEPGDDRGLILITGNEQSAPAPTPVQTLGAWGTGLSHAAEAGADRGLILITGNEQRAHVHPLGGWGTGTTHPSVSGSERLLVFIAGHEHSAAPAPVLTSVTFGGQALTPVDGASAGTSTTARAEIWILNEAGIAAATDATFVPTWDTPPDQPMYSHSLFGGVDQTTPTGAQATNSSDGASPNPITTAALATTSGTDVVVTGAVAGNLGTYTPQNGFVLGNNQDAGATTTLGTATKLATAATETPSMSHSGPNRQVIAGVVLNASTTAVAPTVTSVSFGGQAMTKLTGVSVGVATTAATEIWFLGEAGIAAAADSTFVPTWDTAPDLPMYSHSFFGSVDQTTPTGAQATNSSDAATPNPIATAALSTAAGTEMVVTGAVAGNTGTYTPQNGFSLGNNQNAGATTTLGTASKSAAGATETPSMSHSGPNRQVIAGVVLNASVPGPSVTSVSYGGQAMTKVTGTSVGTAPTASTGIWFLNEAGIAAATDSTFVPTWDTAPDLPMYSHAFFDGVDQSDPIGDNAANRSAAATPNPITTTGLTTVAGDVVVTGAVAGDTGTYTPQNGFSLGNNQTAGATTTLGTADKTAGAGAETPSMSHSGPNRQVIAGAVLNRRRAVVANSWTTGVTHTAGQGDDRMLVFVAGVENGADPGLAPQGQRDLTSVTYGGQSLTPAAEVMICTNGATSSFCARAELWYLLEAGIDAATDSTFVPTWAGDAPYELEEMYAAVTLDRVHQTAPTGNIGTNAATTNPIQPVDPVGVGRGDIVIVAAMGGMSGTYTDPAGYTEGTDQTLLSSTLATAFLEATTDGTEQPSMSFDASINRHVVLAATIKANGTP